MEQIKALNEHIVSGNFEKASKIVGELSLDFFIDISIRKQSFFVNL